MAVAPLSNSLTSFITHPVNQEYIKQNLQRVFTEIKKLSVKPGTLEREALEKRHFNVKEWKAQDGSVAIFGESPKIEGSPTLLLFNNFCGSIGKTSRVVKRGDGLAGRGSTSAGSFYSWLLAIESWQNRTGLPINVKWLIHGNVNDSSSIQVDLIEKYSSELAADGCLWNCGSFSTEGRAIISLGSKGTLSVQLNCRALSKNGPDTLSGVLPSGAWRLIWALNSLKGENEDIKINGFADENDSDLQMLTEDISPLLNSAVYHKTRLTERLKEYGRTAYLMELRDPQVLLTEFLAPSICISALKCSSENGLPASASARIDFKLVPNHTPEKVLKLLEEHLKQQDLGDFEIRVIGKTLAPARTSPNQPFVKNVIESVTASAELVPLVIPLSPDVQPISLFKEVMGEIPVVSLGLNHPSSVPGTRNESFRFTDFEAHCRAVAFLIGIMSEQNSLQPLKPFIFE